MEYPVSNFKEIRKQLLQNLGGAVSAGYGTEHNRRVNKTNYNNSNADRNTQNAAESNQDVVTVADVFK
ncbi:hypothetical protein EVAR_69609_1 [Eumeta japonica]|uniref:Uncharacterized protein n=1 Tax=Eumeta variegata TaxID=151549 RepID=A0A4C1SVD2_EUMVA|nr:hypothetical protein EVAR_69609_1 [Eumeta japonica]